MTSLKQTEKEIKINAPWGNIAAITWGDPANPPVLLGPGRIVPCSCFRPLVLNLPSSFYYIAVDFPGNGLSDHLPKGIRFMAWDLIPTLFTVSEHFKWNNFSYIGHSLGAAVGKYFNMAYPGRINRMVVLDPVPAYLTVEPDNIAAWYREIYASFYEEKAYKNHISDKETAPKYTYEQVKQKIMKAQQLSEEAANHVLDRYIEPAGDGLFRFTYDQRMKSKFILPFQAQNFNEMYTLSKTPTLAILATDSIESGAYSHVRIAMDENAWPNRNYRYKIVKGAHDVHLENPECMVEDISNFLLEGLKAKL